MTRTRTIAPATRTISAATLAKARPAIQYLMSEDGGRFSPESALNIAMDAKRLARFLPIKLSEAQKSVRRGFADTVDGSTVSVIRDKRSGAEIPRPEKKPGESDLDFRKRLRRQVLDLGRPASVAKPVPESASDFAELKAKMLNDPKLVAHERIREAGIVTPATDTTGLMNQAHALMRAKRQSVDPKSVGFSENFKAAIAEIAKGEK